MKDTDSNVVAQARAYAMHAHQRIDHRRKYTGQPYEVHLKAVHQLVSTVSDDPETLAAAWLHDIVEDTTVTIGDVRREFGEQIARLVGELTDVSRPGDGNRAARKAIDRQHLAAASPAAKTVKLADLIDNGRDICKHNAEFAKVYLQEMAALLTVLGEGDARLYKKAWTLCSREAAERKVRLELPASEAGASVEGRFKAIGSERALGLFARSFSAGDVAESVLSFDVTQPQSAILAATREQGAAVALVRRQGRVFGVVLTEELEDADTLPKVHLFRSGQVVQVGAPLFDVVEVLCRQDYCFVEVLGEVAGVITRGDIQKPVVRMWLFGIITMIEMALTSRLRKVFPHGTWRPFLSASRLQKAEELLAERRRLKQRADLIDCLQFGDKGSILLNDPEFLRDFAFTNKSSAKERINDLQSLRNNLAHAQDIVTQDWAQISRLAREVSRSIDDA